MTTIFDATIFPKYVFLFILFFYSIFILYFTRNMKFDIISKAIALAWFKITSIVYIFNFPLIFYVFTDPGVSFAKIFNTILIFYGVTYLVLFLVGNIFTVEFVFKIIKYLTGFDISKYNKFRTKW